MRTWNPVMNLVSTLPNYFLLDMTEAVVLQTQMPSI